mmetsp:Transcript_127235/g.407197  ORF Transcript_127235/g.407197 Transcript_127235/m.407197 type:complete len:239 (-) Transcript_127235:649-1365(-)
MAHRSTSPLSSWKDGLTRSRPTSGRSASSSTSCSRCSCPSAAARCPKSSAPWFGATTSPCRRPAAPNSRPWSPTCCPGTQTGDRRPASSSSGFVARACPSSLVCRLQLRASRRRRPLAMLGRAPLVRPPARRNAPLLRLARRSGGPRRRRRGGGGPTASARRRLNRKVLPQSQQAHLRCIWLRPPAQVAAPAPPFRLRPAVRVAAAAAAAGAAVPCKWCGSAGSRAAGVLGFPQAASP